MFGINDALRADPAKYVTAEVFKENYRNLIVRVWGWSGYFNELDTPFQEHIISRAEYKI